MQSTGLEDKRLFRV